MIQIQNDRVVYSCNVRTKSEETQYAYIEMHRTQVVEIHINGVDKCYR